MNTVLVAALFAVVLLAIASALKQKGVAGKDRKDEEKYVAKPLLSENEKQWFKRISEALPNAHVLSQVAMNQLVRAEGKAWRSAKNKIDPRSIDFVILNSDLSVLLTIEIDDKTHKLEKRQVDDEKKNRALKLAGIPLLRFAAMPVLPAEEVKSKIAAAIALAKVGKLAIDPKIEQN